MAVMEMYPGACRPPPSGAISLERGSGQNPVALQVLKREENRSWRWMLGLKGGRGVRCESRRPCHPDKAPSGSSWLLLDWIFRL